MSVVSCRNLASLSLGVDGELRLEIGESQNRGDADAVVGSQSVNGWIRLGDRGATFMQGAILIGEKGEAEDVGSRAEGLRLWDWRAPGRAFGWARPGCSGSVGAANGGGCRI